MSFIFNIIFFLGFFKFTFSISTICTEVKFKFSKENIKDSIRFFN